MTKKPVILTLSTKYSYSCQHIHVRVNLREGLRLYIDRISSVLVGFFISALNTDEMESNKCGPILMYFSPKSLS